MPLYPYQTNTENIAAHAVTQSGHATGSTSAPTTNSTTYVDMNEMSVTLTTVGGDLLVLLDSSVSNDTLGAGVFVALSLDGASEVAPRLLSEPVATYNDMMVTHHVFTGVAAGSHTVKGRWKVTSGIGTLITVQRALTVIELKR